MGELGSLLEFPCKFPIKMMGRADGTFSDTALRLVERHAGSVAADCIQTTASSNGNFVSLTVTIDARSQEQVDSIYQDLSDHEDIILAL
jgi:hypothetical protein